jgi:hypothetical protein
METVLFKARFKVASFDLLGGGFHFFDYKEIEPKNICEIYKTTTDGIWYLVFKPIEEGEYYKSSGLYTNTANVIRILNVLGS